jgi:NAD(P)-dependent dehydrogenase (short-subunit alcohol dehydrogenase family)
MSPPAFDATTAAQELLGRVAVVTGAGRHQGIGRHVALALARAGADVACVGSDRAPEALPDTEKQIGWRDVESLADEVRGLGRRALALRVDVTDSSRVDRTVRAAADELGHIDIFVYSCGADIRSDRVPVVALREEVWRRVLDVNLTGAFLFCRAVAKEMVEQKRGGKIVTVASIRGKRGFPNAAAYCASKFGLIGFTQALAHELAPDRVNVNAVCPGVIATSRVEHVLQGEIGMRLKRQVPWGRYGQPEEVAELTLFLCSPRADYITGQAYSVCGGWVMG